MSHEKILSAISICENPKMLKQWISNAKKAKNKAVESAAFERLISISPNAFSKIEKNYEIGSVEHDYWKTIYAFEEILTQEAGKTRRLSRTRQKTSRVGEIAMIREWATSPRKSAGFLMLAELDRPDLLGEAIAIRHPEVFSSNEIELAKQKLISAGFNVDTFYK